MSVDVLKMTELINLKYIEDFKLGKLKVQDYEGKR